MMPPDSVNAQARSRHGHQLRPSYAPRDENSPPGEEPGAPAGDRHRHEDSVTIAVTTENNGE